MLKVKCIKNDNFLYWYYLHVNMIDNNDEAKGWQEWKFFDLITL